jgi:hypothetical protein
VNSYSKKSMLRIWPESITCTKSSVWNAILIGRGFVAENFLMWFEHCRYFCLASLLQNASHFAFMMCNMRSTGLLKLFGHMPCWTRTTYIEWGCSHNVLIAVQEVDNKTTNVHSSLPGSVHQVISKIPAPEKRVRWVTV